MADIKISQLGAAATISDSDVFPMTANGTTVKAAASLIKEYAIGDDDISALGDGSPTGAILALNANKSAKSDIAMIEASVAIASHAIGAEFYLSGVLMRATAAIEIGDQIVNGTNCAPADDVSSQIQALTNKIGNGTPTTTDKTIIGAINELYGDIFTKQELNIADVFTPSDANAVNMTTSKAYKIGRKIILQITGVGSITISSNRRYIVGVLKSAYRPSIIQHFAASVNAATSGEVMAPVTGYASTSGNVALIFVEPGAIGNASYPWTSYGLFVTYDLI